MTPDKRYIVFMTQHSTEGNRFAVYDQVAGAAAFLAPFDLTDANYGTANIVRNISGTQGRTLSPGGEYAVGGAANEIVFNKPNGSLPNNRAYQCGVGIQTVNGEISLIEDSRWNVGVYRFSRYPRTRGRSMSAAVSPTLRSDLTQTDGVLAYMFAHYDSGTTVNFDWLQYGYLAPSTLAPTSVASVGSPGSPTSPNYSRAASGTVGFEGVSTETFAHNRPRGDMYDDGVNSYWYQSNTGEVQVFESLIAWDRSADVARRAALDIPAGNIPAYSAIAIIESDADSYTMLVADRAGAGFFLLQVSSEGINRVDQIGQGNFAFALPGAVTEGESFDVTITRTDVNGTARTVLPLTVTAPEGVLTSAVPARLVFEEGASTATLSFQTAATEHASGATPASVVIAIGEYASATVQVRADDAPAYPALFDQITLPTGTDAIKGAGMTPDLRYAVIASNNSLYVYDTVDEISATLTDSYWPGAADGITGLAFGGTQGGVASGGPYAEGGPRNEIVIPYAGVGSGAAGNAAKGLPVATASGAITGGTPWSDGHASFPSRDLQRTASFVYGVWAGGSGAGHLTLMYFNNNLVYDYEFPGGASHDWDGSYSSGYSAASGGTVVFEGGTPVRTDYTGFLNAPLYSYWLKNDGAIEIRESLYSWTRSANLARHASMDVPAASRAAGSSVIVLEESASRIQLLVIDKDGGGLSTLTYENGSWS